MGRKNKQNDDALNKKLLEAKLEEIRKYEKSADYIADKINRQSEKLATVNKKINETKFNLEMLDDNDDVGAVQKAYYISHLEQLYLARAKAEKGLTAYEDAYFALSNYLEVLRSNLNF